jgi:hypothetical protein
MNKASSKVAQATKTKKNSKTVENQEQDDETNQHQTRVSTMNTSEARINTSFFIVLFFSFLLISVLFGLIFSL